MVSSLPRTWVSRIRSLIERCESPVVVLPGEPGLGVERLLGRWMSEGRSAALRAIDLESREAFQSATEAARHEHAEVTLGPSEARSLWFCARGRPASSERATFRPGSFGPGCFKEASTEVLSSLLLPGERLLIVQGSNVAQKAGDPRIEWRLSSEAFVLEPEDVAELFACTKRRMPDGPTLASLMSVTRGRLFPIELARDAPNLPEWVGSALEDPVFATYLQARGAWCQPTVLAEPASEPNAGRVIRVFEPGERTLVAEFLGRPKLTESTVHGRSEVGPEINWGYQAVLEVFALLALADEREMTRDLLADQLWPDIEPNSVRKQLYPAISHLRKLLRGYGAEKPVELAKGVYRLSPSLRLWVDLDQVQTALDGTKEVADDLLSSVTTVEAALGEPVAVELADAQVLLLRNAWRRFRGEFLQGLTNRWITRRRDALAASHLAILRRLASLLGRLRRFEEVEEVVRALLIADPSQEDAYIALMRVYERRGRADLVRRQYERMCSVLLEEFGIQPMDSTIREAERLLA